MRNQVLKKTLHPQLVLLLIVLFLLTSCELSLAQDITPPPEFRRVSVEQSFIDPDITESALEQTESNDIDDITRPTSEDEDQNSEDVEGITANSEAEPGTITGTVYNGSGGDLPTELVINLLEIFEMQPNLAATTTVEPDGSFLFEDIELTEGKIFLATTKFDQMTYTSDFGFVEQEITTLEIPITIYESTTDVSALEIQEMQIGLDFSDADTINILQRFIVSNPSNQTVIPEDPNIPLISIPTPATATNWEFLDEYTSGHLVLTPQGNMHALLPGSSGYELFISYDLAYTRELTFEQDLSWPIKALFVFLPETDVELDGPDLFEVGVDEIGENLYKVYASQGPLTSGEVQFEIRGRNPMDTSGFLGLNIDPSMLVGASALLISIIGVGYLSRGRRGSGRASDGATVSKETPESVMDKIIELDEAFEAGSLAEPKYLERRAALKELLRELLE